MKEETNKSTPKKQVKVKDIAPKKDAKGGAARASDGMKSQSMLRQSSISSKSQS